MRLLILAALLTLLVAPRASTAADGVFEISQACALSLTGCFPGDAPGFPVTITTSAPGRSFRLTSDLGPLGAGQTAIAVSTTSASIDLNGFRIYGGTACSQVPVTCSPLGGGVGVSGGSDVTVRNGTIHGMGNDGVQLGYSSRAEGLHLFHNGGDGLQLGGESLARGNVSTSNGADGIRCGEYCGIHENTATANGVHGIEVSSGSVTGNTANRNGSHGGQFGGDVAFAHNQFAGNLSGDVDGGHAASGNACAGSTCSRRGARLYFLTRTLHTGATALGACGVGYHMAHLAEIHTTSTLEYNSVLGYTMPDSGSGPPFISGWVRNGNFASSATQTPGNCGAWQSAGQTHWGSYAVWASQWTAAATQTAPWSTGTTTCDSTVRVWCVED